MVRLLLHCNFYIYCNLKYVKIIVISIISIVNHIIHLLIRLSYTYFFLLYCEKKKVNMNKIQIIKLFFVVYQPNKILRNRSSYKKQNIVVTKSC